MRVKDAVDSPTTRLIHDNHTLELSCKPSRKPRFSFANFYPLWGAGISRWVTRDVPVVWICSHQPPSRHQHPGQKGGGASGDLQRAVRTFTRKWGAGSESSSAGTRLFGVQPITLAALWRSLMTNRMRMSHHNSVQRRLWIYPAGMVSPL